VKKAPGKTAAEPPQVALWVAVRRPGSGRYYDWALAAHDQGDGRWYQFEAVRFQPRGPFQAHFPTTDPRPTAVRMVAVCRLPRADLADLRETVHHVVINPADANYDNQDYIIAAFDALRRRGFISDGDDEAAWRALMPFFGWQDVSFARRARDRKRALRRRGIILSEEFVYDTDSE